MSETGEAASGRRGNKRAAVFRTIGEVSEDLDLPAHVLRFWESKFPQLKPLKRGGGRRYYRPEDIALLSRIRQCLYQEGYTIRGVQKLLAEGGSSNTREMSPSLFPLDPAPAPAVVAVRPARSPRRGAAAAEPVPAAALSPQARGNLEAAMRELLTVRDLVNRLLAHKKG
ncbi:MAG: MerR family transcriptional regulator [Alphaproteobacteria bacterium]|nr:MerR family transcriptional regulator [Alphaproteobacteria bacterium]